MLQPWNDCGRATVFRVEATADDVATGAEVVEERCTGAADQRFLIQTG
ncbi:MULTISPECIES: hypothetical protein [unclassified Streptomyces]|nr:hypothetical protein [Streptomyces sp. SAT1]